MVSIRSPPEWGIEPIQSKYRSLKGVSYFILWSSLGVGLLVFSAGSFLTAAKFADAVLAIIIGSVVGSLLLALVGKIGSDRAVPSLISTRPSFGIRGSYIPAILNIIQLIGWTTFEIMIMSKASEMLVGNRIPYYTWTIIIGAFVILLGIVGPLTVIRQWLEKFAIWIVYVSSTLIIINLLMSGILSRLLLSSSSPAGMSFFSALDIVIAMPISWMPLVSDYNRFAKNSRGAFSGTFVGFAITNILFYFGGLILGVGDVVAVVAAIQSIFFGLILLMFILHETSNAFADVYSAAVSTQTIFHKIKQSHLIIGFTALSTVLAVMIPISQYETFLLLIGAVFVPLFGVVLSDYYIIKHRRYENTLMYGNGPLRIGFPAIIAWLFGLLLYYLLSSLSPIYISQWPQIGATIPSFIGSSLLYIGIMKMNSVVYVIKKLKN
ncbi:MAG TPA: cytosine permease [Nitrososphaeraceae archaeon]|nr:cytosine permease [Nitrososphaeraceae archaeon]